MPRAVGQFVEDRAVILCGADKLLADGENHFISRGTIEGSVALLVGELYAFAGKVIIYDSCAASNGSAPSGKAVSVVCFAVMPSHWSMWNTL